MEVGEMPKEVITNPDMFAVIGDDEVLAERLPAGGGHALYARGAVIRWNRAQYVELGVAKLEVSTHTEVAPHYVTLGRIEINRLIRALRKARDQAFGADA